MTEQLSLEERVDNRLHRIVVGGIIAFAFFGFSMAVTMAYVYVTAENNKESLCALRADAERRIAQTEDFLQEFPNGIPGISVEQLNRSMSNSIQTRNALSTLNCE